MVVSLHHGVEAVVTVAEVAELAWEAVERRRNNTEHVAQEVVTVYQGCVEVESALARERAENERLRGIVELYHEVLADGHIFAKAGVASLPSSGSGAAELFNQLRMKVESPSFLSKLNSMKAEGSNASTLSTCTSAGGEGAADYNVLPPETTALATPAEERSEWLLVSEGDMIGELKEEQDKLGASGYFIVTQDDIVDGIANCVATYMISIPQAKSMSPQELQETLAKAFATAQNKGRLRKIWDASKICYTLASWGATIVGVYQHPVVIRAAAVAAWTSCRVIAKIVK